MCSIPSAHTSPASHNHKRDDAKIVKTIICNHKEENLTMYVKKLAENNCRSLNNSSFSAFLHWPRPVDPSLHLYPSPSSWYWVKKNCDGVRKNCLLFLDVILNVLTNAHHKLAEAEEIAAANYCSAFFFSFIFYWRRRWCGVHRTIPTLDMRKHYKFNYIFINKWGKSPSACTAHSRWGQRSARAGDRMQECLQGENNFILEG